ncbi:MAG: AraC family transcriptional regulator ligand-binding domain-containing protein [Myxococcota bacterium]
MSDSKRSTDARPQTGVSALLGRALLSNLGLLGFDPEAIRRSAGVEADRLLDARGRLAHREVAAIFTEAERVSGDRTISLRVAGKAQTLAGGGVLGPLVLSSRDGEQALAYLVQYAQLLDNALRIETDVGDESFIIRFHNPDVDVGVHSRHMEALLAAVVRAFELILRQSHAPTRVSFRHSAPPEVEPFRVHFACNVEFEAEHYEVVMPISALRQQTRGAHPRIVEQLAEVAESELRLVSPRFTTAVRERIAMLFEQGERPTRARVAGHMKLTERTLQRRLAEDGTTFREVSDAARRDRACTLLHKADLRVADVAYAVGYDEVASFTKAFRRWTGESPSAFRERALRGA